MQQNILRISWCNDTHGSMEIILDKFFPCTKKKMKNLLKIVSRSVSPEKSILEIKEFLQFLLPQLDAQLKHNANEYFAAGQRVADLTDEIESGNYASGCRIQPIVISSKMRMLTIEKACLKKCLKAAKKSKKLYERCKMNICLTDEAAIG